MFKLRVVAILLVTIGLAVGGTGLAWRPARAEPPAPSAEPPAEKKQSVPRSTSPAKERPVKDMDTLQGAWTMESREFGGRRDTVVRKDLVPDLIFRGEQTAVRGSKYSGTYEGTFRVGPSATPKTMDFTFEPGTSFETVRGAIYKRNGDLLTICWEHGSEGRHPKEFGGKDIVCVYRRVRAEVRSAPTALEKRWTQRIRVTKKMFHLGLAVQTYEAVEGHFPPAALTDKRGQPLLSWRVALLPAIGEEKLYKEFHLDEPWNSKHNAKLLSRMPAIYAPVGDTRHKPHETFFQVFVSSGKAGKKSVFDHNATAQLTDITDGTSVTLLIAEAAKSVPWTQPADLGFPEDEDLPALGGGMIDDGLFSFTMVDGSARWARRASGDKFQKWLRKLVTRDDGDIIDLSAFADE
jgi:uncharacterized protein (TIGR03067 family)